MDCVSTGDLVTMFTGLWNKFGGNPESNWVNKAEEGAPHEANFLKLDCSRLKAVFGWKPVWHIDKAVENVITWTRVWLENGNIREEMDREIKEFVEQADI